MLENCEKFNALNTQIRDNSIQKDDAKKQLKALLNSIRLQASEESAAPGNWIFPLNTYGKKAIGGKNGNGYISAGYNFLDGNKHGGHPAHDIFIVDKNLDSRDDKTGQKIEVKAALSGIVVALEASWNPGSNLRGGKYVMVFHPAQNLISYYAHLDSVQVVIGQKLIAGGTVGILGRSGLNAFKKRSPTHLHLMVLKFDERKGLFPINPFKFWK